MKHEANLPLGYRVEFTWNGGIQVQWFPHTPTPDSDKRLKNRKRSREFLRAYQAARGDFAQHMANKVGGAIAVADTNGEIRVYEPNMVH